MLYTTTVTESAGLLSNLFADDGLIWLVRKDQDPEQRKIADQEVFEWCTTRFGRCSWDREYLAPEGPLYKREYRFYFHAGSDWGYIWNTFYFRNERDATLFKLFWGKDGD